MCRGGFYQLFMQKLHRKGRMPIPKCQRFDIESGSRDVTCNVSTRIVNGVVGAGFTNNQCHQKTI